MGPKKGNLQATSVVLRRCYAERGSKGFWHSEKRDRHLRRRWRAPIASQALWERESVVRPLRARKNVRRRVRWRSEGGMTFHLQALGTYQLDAGASIEAATPVSPEERGSADGQGMQQETDLARFGRVLALPLTLGA